MASNIRVNSNPTGNIHINANDERPRYAGYTITAERSQTEHGTLITAEDWRGITESMVYDGVGIETLVYNDDFTVTITLMDGRTFTTEDTVARGVDQAESAAEHALESQRAASASEEAAAGSATQSSAAAGSALAYANRADTAATAASGYANRARASAESIDGILEAVTDLEASTTQKANEAQNSATQASGSASTATTKAAEAGQSASSASTDASRAESYRTDALNAKTAAETAADNAEASETSANAWAVEASTHASNASASATASATSASEAEASAQAAAQSAASLVIDETLTETGQAAEAKAVGDALEAKAEIDGYYEDMTVGDAEQLISSMYVEDAEPYNYRTTGGSADVGNREYVDAIVGVTVAWNQLANNKMSGTPTTSNGVTLTVNGDGSFTLDGTATASANFNFTPTTSETLVDVIKGHKILCLANDSVRITFAPMFNTVKGDKIVNINETRMGVTLSIYSQVGDVYDNVRFYPMVIDLTQMFGSTIADYIYSLERANAGDGVALFKKLFPKDYYEYNAGELISVSGLQSHDMVGFNMWDEEWELGGLANATGLPFSANDRIRGKNFSKCLPNTNYYCKTVSQYLRVFWYDSEQNFIRMMDTVANSAITSPSNAHYFKIVLEGATTYNNDICINLSWSGWRNGEYEPYEKHSHPLDSSLALRGIPKLDAQNNLYYDGDEYKADGSVTRKWTELDIPTTTITLSSDNANANGIIRFVINTVSKKFGATNIISSLFPTNITVIPSDTAKELVSGYDNGAGTYISIKASRLSGDLTTVEGRSVAFKNWASANNFKVIYELATPTTESAEPYKELQICDDFGTEEFVSTSIVPVGHKTRYPANLRDKLQHLPNLADNDGAYLIRQTNKQMSLEVFRIPKAPTTDGTYVLKAVVSGGTPTYTWESEE